MKKNVVVTILAVALLILVLVSIGYGCSFRMFENFEDMPEEEPEEEAPKKKTNGLTPKEKEMFENIKNGNLTDEDIQKFIADGKLTEKMVEKFLEHIDAMPMPPAVDDDEDKPAAAAPKKAAPAPKKAVPKDDVEDGFDIEGFSGSMFAKY